MAGRLIFILKGYPRLSETFIAQEIRALEKRGHVIDIVSLRFPTDKHVHPVHREIAARVTPASTWPHGRSCRSTDRNSDRSTCTAPRWHRSGADDGFVVSHSVDGDVRHAGERRR